jgi:universal stress protein A
MSYRHIVVAVDFSEAARRAAERAVELARRWSARLTLLHVIEFFPEDIPLRYIAPEDVDPAEYLERRARGELEALAGELGASDAEQLVTLTTHSARHAIREAAVERGVDLIVVGTHGRRGAGQHLGSTAGALLQHAPCDILAVRASD